MLGRTGRGKSTSFVDVQHIGVSRDLAKLHGASGGTGMESAVMRLREHGRTGLEGRGFQTVILLRAENDTFIYVPFYDWLRKSLVVVQTGLLSRPQG